MQILFGQDSILNIKHVADWEHIWQHKQLRFNHNNKHENMPRNNHQYKVGDKITGKLDVSNIVNNNPWSETIATTMFAVRSNYQTTLQSSPIQIVFGRETILNIKHVADWEHIW